MLSNILIIWFWFVGGLSSLDQRIITFFSISKGVILSVKLIIILVSQTKIILTCGSIWICLNLIFLSVQLVIVILWFIKRSYDRFTDEVICDFQLYLYVHIHIYTCTTVQCFKIIQYDRKRSCYWTSSTLYYDLLCHILMDWDKLKF